MSDQKPSVKAAYISEPVLPVSKGIPIPEITSVGSFAIDLSSGQVLYQKNSSLHLKPASLTKIMTALVSLDYYPEDYVLKVINGENSLGNTAKLVNGDTLSARDVLYALLIPSGNDAAVTLAENYPGGYREFISKMNEKAVSLGLSNSHFSNVSGVEGEDHYTTPYDISMIAKEALKRNLFKNIVSTKEANLVSLTGRSYEITSTNILLGKNDIYGVKTGWTPEAGECLVLYAERSGHPILVTVMNSKDRFGEGKALVNWIYENYSWQ